MHNAKLKIGIVCSLLLVGLLPACDNGDNKKDTPAKSVATEVTETGPAGTPATTEEKTDISKESVAPATTDQKKDVANDPVAATVNGVVISRADFDSTLKLAQQQFAAIAAERGDAPASVNVEKEVIERLIAIELMLQDAKKRGITAHKVAVDGEIAGFRNSFKTEQEFTDYLKENNLTVDIIKEQISKENILQQLQAVLLQEMKAKIQVTEKDSKAFYDANKEKFNHPDQVKASHILIKVVEGADEATDKKALAAIEDIRKKAIAGEDFSELAKKYSQGSSNVKGGDLGFFAKGQMQTTLEEAAFTLPINEISQPVKSDYGYHIVKVIEKRPAGTIPFTEVADRISSYLSQKQLDQAQKLYMDDMRNSAKVEIKI